MTTPFEHSENLAGLPQITHGFFGRRGGVSGGIYDSLNVGTGSGDGARNVSQNREIVRQSIAADHLLSCYQIHSASVIQVTEPWEKRPQADAMVTTEPGLALCIHTADCTPILFADPHAGIIGAAHAGWKGALADIMSRTVEAMTALGAHPNHIHAAIGPTIHQPSYEVGPEFRDRFCEESAENETHFIPGKDDRLHFDLPGFIHSRLAALDLASIETLAHDTYAMEDTYFSNRRRNHKGEPDYGRNASVICLSTE